MKKYLFPILILSAVMLTSCLEGSSDYTPALSVSSFFTSSGDTLSAHYNYDDDYYYLDTLAVGDTVKFGVGFSTYTNDLVFTQVIWDSTKLNLWAVPGNITNVLAEGTDTTNVIYYYHPNYNYVAFPVYFIPLQPCNTELQFYVESTAEKVDNSRKVGIRVYAE